MEHAIASEITSVAARARRSAVQYIPFFFILCLLYLMLLQFDRSCIVS